MCVSGLELSTTDGENGHDEPRSGRPSVITEGLVNAVDENIREDRRFTISTLALEFPNVSRTTLHKIVSENLPQMTR